MFIDSLKLVENEQHNLKKNKFRITASSSRNIELKINPLTRV